MAFGRMTFRPIQFKCKEKRNAICKREQNRNEEEDEKKKENLMRLRDDVKGARESAQITK